MSDMRFTNPTPTVGSVAIAKPIIAESNAQMRKLWCHDNKIWPWHKWNHVIWSDGLSLTLFPTSGRIYVCRTLKKSVIRNACFQQWNTKEIMWYIVVPCWSHCYPSSYTLQVSTWRGWKITCIPRSRRHFRITMLFSKATTAPLTQIVYESACSVFGQCVYVCLCLCCIK
jgi:hypothetical protein